jgi:hypothetical protein
MDPMSTIPSMTGGAGGSAGPSNASGSFFTSLGGMDGSGWNIAFGQASTAGTDGPAKSTAPSVATPVSVGYSPDQFGLPNFMMAALGEQTAHTTTTTTAAVAGVSPFMLVAIALVAVLILKHAK